MYKSSAKYYVCVNRTLYKYYLTMLTLGTIALNLAYVLLVISLIIINSMYKYSAKVSRCVTRT